MNEPVIMTLTSRTVFWRDDLNVPLSLIQGCRSSDTLYNKAFGEMEEWLEENCTVYRVYERGVWFNEEKEALAFLLTWQNRITDPRDT